MLRPAEGLGQPRWRWPSNPPARGVVAVVALLRPGQWPKNLLCLAAPAAAGVLAEPHQLGRAAAAAMAFTFASCAVYAANDVVDAAGDRQHPTKRLRPVASGGISVPTALAVAAGCATVGLALSALLGWMCMAVVGSYLLSSGAYILWLRRVPVLDVVTVAVGFVLRSLAGAAAVHVAVSSWFLLVALFGSLFLVCAKRRAELSHAGPAVVRARATLGQYSLGWLDQVVTMSLAGTVLAYATWAFQPQSADTMRSLLAVSVLPMLIALLRYLLLVDRGDGERPERSVADPIIVACAVVWCVLVTGGLYLA